MAKMGSMATVVDGKEVVDGKDVVDCKDVVNGIDGRW